MPNKELERDRAKPTRFCLVALKIKKQIFVSTPAEPPGRLLKNGTVQISLFAINKILRYFFILSLFLFEL
jgi:hypothetical protein